MKLVPSLLLIIILLSNTAIQAQNYIAPVNFRMLLSGTFGELRGNHFHAGIDIKTEGVEGQKIFAIADGYVSRIKVSTWGYGKAIYINHPDGRTSVYAHLQKFSSKIDKFVKQEHYKKESFEINFYPHKDSLKVKQGEIIALSGNSGGSAGAHLHFEIRDTKTEHPVNPLQFGFKIDDTIAPTLKKLKLYALDSTTINSSTKDIVYTLKKNNTDYTLAETPTISGPFAIGISTYDKFNNSYNKNGVYAIKLCIDSSVCYEFKVDELDFSTSRYINAHMDYFEKKENKDKYHKCYKLATNKLTNYTNLINNGIITFTDDSSHLVTLAVSDLFGNTANLSFNVQSKKPTINTIDTVNKPIISQHFAVEKANIYKAKDFELHMDKNSLYEPLDFTYSSNDSIAGIFGLLHQCHNDRTPVHKKYVVSLKADVPDTLKNKVFIAKKVKNNFWYMGGDWKDDYLRTKVREFGDFCIIADTINPEIKGVNIFPGKVFNTQTTIKCTIKDKESGIKSYRGEIDGKWVLLDYDYKRNLVRFDIDKSLTKGKHTFTLEVSDKVGNITNYKAIFTY